MMFQPVIPALAIIFLAAILAAFGGFLMGHNWRNNTRMQWCLRAGTLLLMCLLLARPGVATLQEQDTYTSEYDIYFAVDTTASMAAEDWQEGTEQTRLDAAKQDILQLVQDYPDARYSLITTNAFLRIVTPLTRDSVAFVSSVDYLQPEITRFSQGSHPQVLTEELGSILEANAKTNPDRSTLVFVFADGETTNDNPIPAQEGGVGSTDETPEKKYVDPKGYITSGGVLGYGTEKGGKMKTQQGFFITNEQGYIEDPDTGEPAISRIDEPSLQTISDALGVEYTHRTVDTNYAAPGVDGGLSIQDKIEMNSVMDLSWVVGLLLILTITVDAGLVLRKLRKQTLQMQGKE